MRMLLVDIFCGFRLLLSVRVLLVDTFYRFRLLLSLRMLLVDTFCRFRLLLSLRMLLVDTFCRFRLLLSLRMLLVDTFCRFRLLLSVRVLQSAKKDSQIIENPFCLMLEVTHLCEYHCDTVFVAFINGILVTLGSTWLDNRFDSCFCSIFYGVWHWEKCV